MRKSRLTESNQTDTRNKLSSGRRAGRNRMVRQAAAFVSVLLLAAPQFIYASSLPDVSAPFEALLSIVTTILSSIGEIITLWGIGEWGLSYQANEGSMQAASFKRIGGGFVMILAPQIFAAILS